MLHYRPREMNFSRVQDKQTREQWFLFYLFSLNILQKGLLWNDFQFLEKWRSFLTFDSSEHHRNLRHSPGRGRFLSALRGRRRNSWVGRACWFCVGRSWQFIRLHHLDFGIRTEKKLYFTNVISYFTYLSGFIIGSSSSFLSNIILDRFSGGSSEWSDSKLTPFLTLPIV